MPVRSRRNEGAWSDLVGRSSHSGAWDATPRRGYVLCFVLVSESMFPWRVACGGYLLETVRKKMEG